MYQSISQRFRRKNSNDLIVTFLPVVVVLTLHSYLRNADLNPTLFRVLQITAIVLLAALLAAVNHFYFRSFCLNGKKIKRGNQEQLEDGAVIRFAKKEYEFLIQDI